MNYFNTQRYTLTGKMERKCAATVMSHGHSVESAVLKKKGDIFNSLFSEVTVLPLFNNHNTQQIHDGMYIMFKPITIMHMLHFSSVLWIMKRTSSVF